MASSETPGRKLWLSLYQADQYDQQAATIAPDPSAGRMDPDRATRKWLEGMSRYLKSSFPEKLQLTREDAGLTQKQLAERVQMSTTGLAMIERGERAPNLDTAARICWALDTASGIPDPRWEVLFPDARSLESELGRWPVSDAVPERIVDYLRLARALLVHSYFDYDIGLVASMWTMLALEATLRGCLNAKTSVPFQRLIVHALDQGLIDEEGAEILNHVRGLRNTVSHNAVSFDVQPQHILEWVRGLHDAISEIYTRAASQPPE